MFAEKTAADSFDNWLTPEQTHLKLFHIPLPLIIQLQPTKIISIRNAITFFFNVQ
jgi:hypothetical protein